MDPIIGGSLIAAGGSLAGGLMNAMFDKSDKIAEQNYNSQKEFAQNSIQWRVQDAKKAGLHPLAALGTQGSYYTPSAQTGGSNMGDYVAQAGGQVGQAMMMKAQLENMKLQNNKLRAETDAIKAQNSAQMPLAKPALQDITKTSRDYSNVVAQGKTRTHLSEKTAPQYQLETINSGKANLAPREGSQRSEEYSEGGLLSKYLMQYNDMKEARQVAKDLNRLDKTADWFATPNVDGSISLINKNDPNSWNNSSLLDKADYYWYKVFD